MRNGDILRDGKEKRFRRNRFSFQRNCLPISSVLPFLICSGCAVPVGMVSSALASCAAAVAKYPREVATCPVEMVQWSQNGLPDGSDGPCRGGSGMPSYIMALDAGTTSNRCILFDRAGHVCSMAQKEFTQFFPKPGLGGARCRGDLVSTVEEVAQQAMREHRRVSLGHCRHWHHQPAGNHRGLEQRHRPPRLSGNRLAVPPDRRVLRQPEGAGPGGAHPAKDRPGAGRLLLRPQSSGGFWSRRPAPGHRRREGSCALGPWKPGSSGSSPGADSM